MKKFITLLTIASTMFLASCGSSDAPKVEVAPCDSTTCVDTCAKKTETATATPTAATTETATATTATTTK